MRALDLSAELRPVAPESLVHRSSVRTDAVLVLQPRNEPHAFSNSGNAGSTHSAVLQVHLRNLHNPGLNEATSWGCLQIYPSSPNTDICKTHVVESVLGVQLAPHTGHL